ncbi:Nif3-like dinuclear metal center hexameric protein [candidate division BRC1 bacterium HGW-BRC1-1]|jgi:dinuclear metal center YbgI/SA1388 family protein|nr:MAG: Nif3-like dinuclear metal center hexameric protein [candidate division BRC1 bacterium HGW-BRC1-1]
MAKKSGAAVRFTLGDLSAAVDALAPFRLAYDWDNVGLQIGDPAASVTNVLIALEVDNDAIDAAVRVKAQAIVAHHPLIFRPLKNLREDSVSGALIARLVRGKIGLIAAHTNLDRVKEGTNGALAAAMDLQDTEILEPLPLHDDLKFVVFVPPENSLSVIDAIHRGGGAMIGNYSHCTFRSTGSGTFIPGEGADPTIGVPGKLEQTPEDRLEAVVPEHCIRAVLEKVRDVHPYETMGYDIIRLFDAEPSYGLGLIGRLPVAMKLEALAQALHKACDADATSIVGRASTRVRRIAVVSGSAGGSLAGLSPARCDAVVTGELGYHMAAEARDRGLNVVLLGHAASEKIFAPHFARQLGNKLADAPGGGPKLHTHTRYRDPAQTVAVRSATKTSRRK